VHHRCDACAADGARLRCSKCQARWFCDRACAKRAWRWHKLYCTDNPVLKRHVSVEMALERILAKHPKSEVPDGAQCYICLDSGDVMRGCACRGPSAGFAHVDCLAEMAAHDPWIVFEGRGELYRWTSCGTCQQAYDGTLLIDMARRCWRHSRDAQDCVRDDDKRRAIGAVAALLRHNDENDAADRLSAEANRGWGRDDPDALHLEIVRATSVRETNPDAALEILTRLRPRTAQCSDHAIRGKYANSMALVLGTLGRPGEALVFSGESVQVRWRALDQRRR